MSSLKGGLSSLNGGLGSIKWGLYQVIEQFQQGLSSIRVEGSIKWEFSSDWAVSKQGLNSLVDSISGKWTWEYSGGLDGGVKNIEGIVGCILIWEKYYL